MADYFEDFKLKVFLTVSRLGSFTLAARELGVSQPAVSQNITSLEKSLGVQLLERRRGDVFLTDAGRSFIRYAQNINYWYDAADRMFGEQGLATSGRPVKIAADAICADYILPHALSDLASSHPELAFEVVPCSAEAGIASSVFEKEEEEPDLLQVPGSHFGRPDDADVEITASPSPKTMDFEGESRLAGVMDAALVASPVNRSMFQAASASEDDRLPFSTIAGVHVSNKFAVWDGYRQFLAPDILARVCVCSSSAELIKAMVRTSDHIVGILPEPAAADEIKDGRLMRLPVRLPEFTFDIHFNPLPEFAGRTVCHLLKESLR
ncbi:MAG: LysR family transcriptional regulator [Bacteroidales bacterium]|nr:LysR family transcriptional regulator [Bacteroidales bacterium]